jgi:starch-binding outer membrane protein, SusD/RagB family
MRHTLHVPRAAVAGAALLLALSTAGCESVRENLLAADDPDIISPDAVRSAEGAEALRIGSLGRLREVTAGGEGAWLLGGLLVDEWKSSDTFSQRNETDERKVQDNNGNVNTMLRALYRPRTSAREALNALREYRPTPTWSQGQMYFVMGFAELTLAETFCSGIPLGDASSGAPEYGPPLTNQQVFAIALAHFDSALALATGTDAASVEVRNSAAVARARTLLNVGHNRAADAATAVSAVPTTFQLRATFSLTAGNNQIWSLNTNAKRWTVGDSFDASGLIRNALPFASAGDTRVRVTGTTLGTSPAGRGFDTQTNFIFQLMYGRTDPTPIVSGIDARLIEAEAKLIAGDFTGMTTTLNTLRSATHSIGAITTATLPALTAPTTRDAAINLFFREKAFWTYGRGQRLPDLRRLVRQYGRPQTSVFPQGTFFKTNTPYGTDVNFPITRDELNNPQFTGCLDRNA